MCNEIWKDIEGYEGLYQVSNLGRVKSLEKIRGVQFQKEKILIPQTIKGGYLRIGLSKNGKSTKFLIHRLVAEAFIPKHFTVNHKDGNKTNNSLDNLEWVSQKENNIHAYQTGLKPHGTQRKDAKLNEQQIKEIRSNYIPNDRNYSTRSLAQKYGVHPSIIQRVVNNKAYKNITQRSLK